MLLVQFRVLVAAGRDFYEVGSYAISNGMIVAGTIYGWISSLGEFGNKFIYRGVICLAYRQGGGIKLGEAMRNAMAYK